MSRYNTGEPVHPKCRHVPKVRVSSHENLQTGYGSDEPFASTYCCDREACLDDAKEWLLATTRRSSVYIVELRRR